MDKYKQFLEQKKKAVINSGFEPGKLNKNLFKFQDYVVRKALIAGKYAIFSDTGTGKTIMQLEWANQVRNKTQKPVLILAPLAVSGQTIKEGAKFGIEIEKLNTNIINPVNSLDGIYITNYEQLENIDCSIFGGICLDESSILKNFTGVRKRLIIEKFEKTRYKLACTATPSPNDINEIGNHSDFLNIMDAQDMRARWFVRDEGMNNYRLKGHAKKDFYAWVGSWCTMITRPADIGFMDEDSKYNLPELLYNEIKVTSIKKDNGKLFNDVSVDATSFNRELRRSIKERCNIVADIVNKSNETYILWCNLNDESDFLEKLIPDAKQVKGSESVNAKESKLLGFAAGEFRVLITKKKIAQFGLNYQHCNNQIFVSLDFSFEGLYQAIRRSYRFGQLKDVNITLVTLDTMQNVMTSIQKKEAQFNELKSELNTEINKEYKLKMEYTKREVKTDNYHLINGDSVVEIDNFEDNSFDFSIFSPPFSMLFTYSDSYRDMGNCDSHSEFFEQNQFLLDKLFKKMKPGRIVCIHSKDLAKYKNSSGYSGLYDFTGDYHRAMEKAGFRYHSKVTIWTDPVLEMQRTKTQRLLYKQLRKDSLYSGVGLPEYITIFKKWDGIDENTAPVNNKNFDNFNLDMWQDWASPVWGGKIKKDDLKELITYYATMNGIEDYQKLIDMNPEWLTGSWFDIRRTDVLNKKKGTDHKDEKHIAPLQLSVIRRCVTMWTNPGDVVFTPFAGIGSELYESIKLGRKAKGIELKESYFDTAVRNLNGVELSMNQLEAF